MSRGRVAGLFRYPVKSMEGEALAEAAVGPAGLPGDRGWALRDASGRPLSAKRHAGLMLCRARFLGEPSPGSPPPPAEVELPDGTRARSDDPAAAALLSRFLDVECSFGVEPGGAGHFDARPLHLLTASSLAALAGAEPAASAVARFRPNVVIETDETGRPEDAWCGTTVTIGAVAVAVAKPVKRCVMTTLPQPGLAAAPGVLKAILAAGGCFGVYAAALGPGRWRAGDAVQWTRPS